MTHSCSLCGYRFDEHEMAASGCNACGSSVSGSGCGLVRCPSCGYEWPPESGSTLAKLIKKLFPTKESARDQT